MNKLFATSLIFASTLAAAACDEGQTGIAIDVEPGVAAGALVVADGFEVTRLEALVSELKILPDGDNVDGDKFKAKGDFWVDALSPDDSIIPAVSLSAGNYKKVEWKFAKPKSGAGLDGTDAVIALDVIIDGQPIAVRLGTTQKVTLRDESGIDLASGETSSFLLLLDVASWFDAVDVDALDVDADGVARIDDKSNEDAYDTIAGNLLAAIKIARKP